MTDLLIFDLDGTLFKTESVDIYAFNEALTASGYSPKSKDEILSFVGLPLDGICRAMLNSEDIALISKFRQDVIHFESYAIPRFGEFYDGAIEMLKTLKDKGFKLCICSNGNKEYIEDISDAFGLWEIFDDIWYEHPGISKAEAVKILIDKYSAKSFIMVGDRDIDIHAAKANTGISIGVTYGFGIDEVKEADYVVNSIAELEQTILQLTS